MPTAATHADSLRLKVSGSEIQNLAPVRTIPGVAIRAAAGKNGPGSGVLRSHGDGTSLSWQAPGGAAGAQVAVAADGEYLLEDGDDANKFLRVEVYVDELIGGAARAAVKMADVYENGVVDRDVTAAEAAAGALLTHTVTLANDGPMGLVDVTVWIDSAAAGWEISSDGATWLAPDDEAHPDVIVFPLLAAGGTDTLHVRRTVVAGANSDPDILGLLHFKWKGF